MHELKIRFNEQIFTVVVYAGMPRQEFVDIVNAALALGSTTQFHFKSKLNKLIGVSILLRQPELFLDDELTLVLQKKDDLLSVPSDTGYKTNTNDLVFVMGEVQQDSKHRDDKYEYNELKRSDSGYDEFDSESDEEIKPTFKLNDAPFDAWKSTSASWRRTWYASTPINPSSPIYTGSNFNSSSLNLQKDEKVIVVVPSLSFDPEELNKIAGILFYEERQLFNLLQLRYPHIKMIFLSSMPLHPSIIEYYLSLLPNMQFRAIKRRLLMLSTYDSSTAIPLSDKILQRPRLVRRIKNAIGTSKSTLICIRVSSSERQLAKLLGSKLVCTDETLLEWGTKRGSRILFKELGIPHPEGIYHCCYSTSELARVIYDMAKARNFALKKVIIKLNEGFSGEGNSLLDLSKIIEESGELTPEKIERAFAGMSFVSGDWEKYHSKIKSMSG
eukprot:TRINITY_DN1313_c0_g1_i5.p1 TRINITY_DN1313_c0_g1~~TRINITY_DN1313_c0_g1_i5.p1  ORF type:complete len:443 (+),score=60.53 TRINITY_DN1313_c0_g1_i5:52-1380(+)